MSEVMLCGRPGKCCAKAKTLPDGSLELKDKNDGENLKYGKRQAKEVLSKALRLR